MGQLGINMEAHDELIIADDGAVIIDLTTCYFMMLLLKNQFMLLLDNVCPHVDHIEILHLRVLNLF